MELDGLTSTVCLCLLWPLTFWPKNLIIMTPGPCTHVTWFWWNWLQQLRRYCIYMVFIAYTWFSGSSPAVTLIFDLLSSKSNQCIYEPKYIRDQNCVKFPSLVFEIWCSQGFLGRTDLITKCLRHRFSTVAD